MKPSIIQLYILCSCRDNGLNQTQITPVFDHQRASCESFLISVSCNFTNIEDRVFKIFRIFLQVHLHCKTGVESYFLIMQPLQCSLINARNCQHTSRTQYLTLYRDTFRYLTVIIFTWFLISQCQETLWKSTSRITIQCMDTGTSLLCLKVCLMAQLDMVLSVIMTTWDSQQ